MEPVIINKERRLAARGIETGYHLDDRHFIDKTFDHMLNHHLDDRQYFDLANQFPGGNDPMDEPSREVWPRRLKTRCRFFVDHFHGKEIYEMWLRTSAGKERSIN